MIPYLDLRKINLRLKKEFMNSLEEVLESGWFILGKRVDEFEKEFAKFTGTKYCAGVANGLDGLILSLKALGIGPGDEVIVPSNTYIASWLAVSYTGATPIPVEPRWETCNINPDLIEAAIGPRTKVIMPVNLYGQVSEMDKICGIAEKRNLYVLEDNAQSQGAVCAGKAAGAWGHINSTSFYPGKNLGALGDAGAITSDDESLINKVKVIRNYGSEKKYYNETKGFNSRLDELQAAFLSVKLKHLTSENNERKRLAMVYNNELREIGDLFLQQNGENCDSVYHIYQIRTERRDALQSHLTGNGIGTMIHYPVAPHLQKAYEELNYDAGDFPLAEKIAATTLSIPLFPGMTQEQQYEVIGQIRKFYNG